jgi:hypothetical protein
LLFAYSSLLPVGFGIEGDGRGGEELRDGAVGFGFCGDLVEGLLVDARDIRTRTSITMLMCIIEV